MLIGVFEHTVMITAFVLMMMVAIEYINVQTRGVWQANLRRSRLGQYLLAATLGVLPGCLGAFAVVSLYSHRMVSFGALVAAMIATSGDEAFVMLALFPADAMLLNALLFLIALIGAALSDLFFKNQERFLDAHGHGFELHEEEECRCFSMGRIPAQLRHMSLQRMVLIALFGLFFAALVAGWVGPETWNWKRVTFAVGCGLILFIVTTVPEHFLRKHLFEHVLKQHLLRIFLWTFAALLAVRYIELYVDAELWLREHPGLVLATASLLGIIPESGPHLIFATMYNEGLVPFAVLLASSISQSGHGTLPLLAVSTRAFIWLQIVAVTAAMMAGAIGLLLTGGV
jgi:hypothetical protein